MILSEALQKNGYAVSFVELVSFHDVPCMPGVRFLSLDPNSEVLDPKIWLYPSTPVPQCMKLSSAKRWPWSFRGSCCRGAPEPLLLDTAQRCAGLTSKSQKIGLKMVGSSNAISNISNCPISWLWVKRICIRKTGLVNTKALPCWDKTTHIRTCLRQSRYFAPRFSFRCSLRQTACRRFCWKYFFLWCMYLQPTQKRSLCNNILSDLNHSKFYNLIVRFLVEPSLSTAPGRSRYPPGFSPKILLKFINHHVIPVQGEGSWTKAVDVCDFHAGGIVDTLT